jgi:uncharacterized protein (DUF362 family)
MSMTRRTLLGLVPGAAVAGALGRSADAHRSDTPMPGEPVDRSARAPASAVGIGRLADYERKAVTAELAALFDRIGGVRRLVSGKTVTIKPNITGTPGAPCLGVSAERSYQTPFVMVLATVDLLRRAGARRFRIVESIFGHQTFEDVVTRAGWDWQALQAAGGEVLFEDTHNRGSYKDYARVKVPYGGYMFASYDLNRAYDETDVYVSIAKLKDHWNGGVTLAIKNSFGITPNSLYGNDAGKEEATGARIDILHKGEKDPPAGVPRELRKDTPRLPDYRVPRVTTDMLGIRPIDLSIIDGGETIMGGEGPWIQGVAHCTPHVLLAGRNPVCTDAVGAAVMGHDPMAKAGTKPFAGDNHLQLAARAGLGTNDPSRIEVRGLSVQEARLPFSGPKRTEFAAG